MTIDVMEKIVSLSKRRGFIFPGSEIYGGLANSWDYGPLGDELKNNIRQEWRKWFIHSRSDMVGIDAALIMNPKVWEASGHLYEFSDPLVECKKCHVRYRDSDFFELGDSYIWDRNLSSGENKMRQEVHYQMTLKHRIRQKGCRNCGGKEFTEPKHFNLMLKTFLGSVDPYESLFRMFQVPISLKDDENRKKFEEARKVYEDSLFYLRPETAQGIFANFKNVLDTSRMRVPFGIAQIGKAFRNEITPGNFIFRMREFEQMEIEYFIREEEWEKWFKYWLLEMKKWLAHLGISEKKLHFPEISEGERAHYSKRTVDIEYDYPFGRKELYGLAYRTDFDLKNHMEKSGVDLRYTDPETNEKFLPHVIEPTFGLDRSVLAAMLEAYHEEKAPTAEEGETDKRVVMKFPFWMAPVKVTVLPLSKKEELTKITKPLYENLAKEFVCEYDETQSIGRRYRRQDEIGTPFCVTVDFETLEDKAVTVRDRDTMKQERVAIPKLSEYIYERLK